MPHRVASTGPRARFDRASHGRMLAVPSRRTSVPGARRMMELDRVGGRIFTLRAPGASVVEVTIDFGGGLVRTMGMHRRGDDWSIRLHPGLPCLRYRFRVDGHSVAPEGIVDRADPATAVWCEIRPAA